MTAPDASSPPPDRLAFREASTEQMEQRKKGGVQHGGKNKTLKCFTLSPPPKELSLFSPTQSLSFNRKEVVTAATRGC